MPERTGLLAFPLKILPLTTLVFFLAASCTTLLTPSGTPSMQSREDENFQDFMDVPYPSAMTLEKSRVEIYERRGITCGTYSVLGSLSSDELMDYYDRHLPPHGWAPQAEAQTEKEIISTWIKGNKTLTIETTKVTLSIGADTRVKIWVASPHTKGDLGKRVIYRDTADPGKTWTTTPVRQGGGGQGGGGQRGDVQEENL